MKIVIKPLILIVVTLSLLSFARVKTLKGTWKYVGGYYNGRKEEAPKGYDLQREYTDTTFAAYMVEKGSAPEKYQTGKYELRADTCFETETWNVQSKKLTGVVLQYHYIFRHDTLYLKGRLPSGMYVLECWKRTGK